MSNYTHYFFFRKENEVFGKPTAELSAANSDHALKDGAHLILTSAIFADRTGNKYGFKIIPHEDFSKKWYYCPALSLLLQKALQTIG